jgi:alkanesulfonate monooxygenase SsuD/methylene tetrahydromethanopterin reductase-like flavin-dependent oxidoreductase (luciferase family)
VPPPLARAEDIDLFCRPEEKAGVDRALACAVVGAPDAVRDGISTFIAQHRPDELMLTANVFDHEARVRSFELAMRACAR